MSYGIGQGAFSTGGDANVVLVNKACMSRAGKWTYALFYLDVLDK